VPSGQLARPASFVHAGDVDGIRPLASNTRSNHGGGTQGEPVDLLNTYNKVRIHRWRTGAVGTWRETNVAIGVLPDGRWFLDARNHKLAFRDEEAAQDAARELMAEHGGEWVEVDP
jgi:hypothetical protein